MKTLKAYIELRSNEFSHRDAVSLIWQIWRMKYFPYRLYRYDAEASEARDDFVYSQKTWNWRGRVLWRTKL